MTANGLWWKNTTSLLALTCDTVFSKSTGMPWHEGSSDFSSDISSLLAWTISSIKEIKHARKHIPDIPGTDGKFSIVAWPINHQDWLLTHIKWVCVRAHSSASSPSPKPGHGKDNLLAPKVHWWSLRPLPPKNTSPQGADSHCCCSHHHPTSSRQGFAEAGYLPTRGTEEHASQKAALCVSPPPANNATLSTPEVLRSVLFR